MFGTEDELYDSMDPYDREPITRADIDEYPVLDDNGDERRLFTSEGYRVPRRVPRFLRDTLPFGALLDFSRIHEMFEASAADDNSIEDGTTPFTVYPQAGLLSCGHIASKGLMFPYRTPIRTLNMSLRGDQRDEDMDMDIDDDNSVTEHRLPIKGISSQVYNSAMHNTRGSSTQHHGVVLGNVTAALASYWTENTSASHKAEAFTSKCDRQLPHEEYHHKITSRPISRDLRLENVYAITMSAIHPTKRNGR
jgi:hypothetical protein